MPSNIKLGYLASCYPCVSHTFITREIASLRILGKEVFTYSMNAPQGPFSIDSHEIKDQKTTGVLRSELFRKCIWISFSRPKLFKKWVPHALSSIRGGNASLIKKIGYSLEGLVLAAELEKNGIQHLHVHFVNPAADVAHVAARTVGIKWSLSVHGPDSMEDISKFEFKKRVQAADQIRVISKFARQQVLRHGGEKLNDKISVIHCGVKVPSQISTNTDHPNLSSGLTVGRLVTAKGQAFLLHALHDLKHHHGLVLNWHFIGNGADESDLRILADRLNLNQQVHFHGARDQNFVQSMLDNCDLFVLPSLAEGIPVSLMEAMAMTKPVVSCRTNGIPELIKNGVNGYLCEPSDRQDLARVLLETVKHPDRREAMAFLGRKTVEREFNQEKVGREMCVFFHESESQITSISEMLNLGKAA